MARPAMITLWFTVLLVACTFSPYGTRPSDAGVSGDGDVDDHRDADAPNDGDTTFPPDCGPFFEFCDYQDNDCDGTVDEGFQDLSSDWGNCGGCGIDCTTVLGEGRIHQRPVCRNGHCGAECYGGWLDCDARTAGCETPAIAPEHCGDCLTSCPVEAPYCMTGDEISYQCVNSCDAGLTPCDSSCVNLASNVHHCGWCDHPCVLPHAEARCLDGGCVVARCDPGWGDCDSNPDNGCETELTTTRDCGECNQRCPQPPHSIPDCIGSGTCVFECEPGFANCTSDPGCETELGTLTNCNACHDRCPRIPGSRFECVLQEGGSGHECRFSGCDPGYFDCDANPDNGCEAVATSPHDCGSCWHVCSSEETCQRGECVLPSPTECPQNESCSCNGACGGGATCSCEAGCHCGGFRCPGGSNCSVGCAGEGTSCAVVVEPDAGVIHFQCKGGASCSLDARHSGAPIDDNVVCEGSGTECRIFCAPGHPCSPQCTEGASCLLVCGITAERCAFTSCDGIAATSGTVRDCASGVVVCNGECPPRDG